MRRESSNIALTSCIFPRLTSSLRIAGNGLANPENDRSRPATRPRNLSLHPTFSDPGTTELSKWWTALQREPETDWVDATLDDLRSEFANRMHVIRSGSSRPNKLRAL